MISTMRYVPIFLSFCCLAFRCIYGLPSNVSELVSLQRGLTTTLNTSGVSTFDKSTPSNLSLVNAEPIYSFNFVGSESNFSFTGYLDLSGRQPRGFDTAPQLTLFRELTRPSRTQPEIPQTISFYDVELSFELRTVGGSLWQWSDLDKALNDLVGYLLPETLEPRLLTIRITRNPHSYVTDSYLMLIVSEKYERTTLAINSGRGSFQGSIYENEVLNSTHVQDAIDFWKQKWHRHWGNPLLRDQQDTTIVHDLQLSFRVIEPETNKYRDLETLLDNMAAYVRLQRNNNWATTLGFFGTSARGHRTQSVFIQIARRRDELQASATNGSALVTSYKL